MKQKPSKYGKSKREQFKAFLDGFFSSSAASLPGGVSSPVEPQWLQLLCLSLVVMRCQPLRRALCDLGKRSFEWKK
ncbi:hypothetical protein [Vibrio cholerae]|uniref:hypothetical protein n=1 Tax=Vibrio cholerae TaxID=666 RepID=UPI00069DD2CD|nr:hypothetical protein [Vibrio cholerae]